MKTKQLPDDYHEWIKAQTFAIGGKKIGLRPTLPGLIRDGCKYCRVSNRGAVRIHGFAHGYVLTYGSGQNVGRVDASLAGHRKTFHSD
jgi:hypothetical protein